MKIIDENFDSFEDRTIGNLNTLQRYITVKPEVRDISQYEESCE